MSARITRMFRPREDVAIETGATTAAIDMRDSAGGTIDIPTTAGASITTLTYWQSHKKDGTFTPLYDKNGNAVAQTVAHTQSHPIHEAAFGCGFIKLYGNAAGVINVSLKG